MSNDMHPEPHYQGLWSRLYGIETKSALKFSFPSSDRVVGQGVSPPVMGHVLVKVYEAAEDGVRMIENHERKPFQAEYVSSKLKDGLATASDDTSKYLRSVEGTTSIQTVSTPTVASVNYRKVRLLCEIKLYYRSS